MKHCRDSLNQKSALIDGIVKESGENNDTAIQLWLQLKRGWQRPLLLPLNERQRRRQYFTLPLEGLLADACTCNQLKGELLSAKIVLPAPFFEKSGEDISG